MWTSELQPWTWSLRLLLLGAAGSCAGVFAFQLHAVPPLEAPRYGLRGKKRALARKQAGFRLMEGALLVLGGWLQRLPFAGPYHRLANLIRRAGEPAGLSAEELLALSLLSFATLGLGARSVVAGAGLSPAWQLGVMVLGTVLPVANVHQTARERAKQLERSLPTAMDLCVLCMTAGSDFPGALRFVVEELGATHPVCHEELALVLDALQLGRTRVEALTGLGERTQSAAVRDFVAAVCQSETKGTPLVDALTIQATTLRRRRSVLAEEAAAKAAVRLMLPLMLMVASLLLIVFGPFLVHGLGM